MAVGGAEDKNGINYVPLANLYESCGQGQGQRERIQHEHRLARCMTACMLIIISLCYTMLDLPLLPWPTLRAGASPLCGPWGVSMQIQLMQIPCCSGHVLPGLFVFSSSLFHVWLWAT